MEAGGKAKEMKFGRLPGTNGDEDKGMVILTLDNGAILELQVGDRLKYNVGEIAITTKIGTITEFLEDDDEDFENDEENEKDEKDEKNEENEGNKKCAGIRLAVDGNKEGVVLTVGWPKVHGIVRIEAAKGGYRRKNRRATKKGRTNRNRRRHSRRN